MATAISPHSLLREVVTEFARLSETTLFTFPAGDPDPVRIGDEDLQSLQPERHLSISIIDFYIKYLEREVLSFEDKDRFFFFKCSFFISSFGTKIPCTDNDYEWIGGVNLFEKDYIFIPVLKREHWSLIILYHLNCLTRSPTDIHYRSPCIFHLDSVEGKDDGLEGDIRSFIFKSWTDIHQNSDVLRALFHMKYVEAKVPQEDNGYDSGIYVLHYVEHFILESASPDFSFGTEQVKSHFPGWDTSEAVAKRKHIQNLLFKLSGMTQLQGTLRLHSSDIFSWLRVKAASEGRIEDGQNSDLTMVNGKGADSEHGGHQTGGVTVLNEHQPFIVNQALTLSREEIRLSDMEEMRGLLAESLRASNDTPFLCTKSEKRRPRGLNWSTVESSGLLYYMDRFHRFRKGNIATPWDVIAEEVSRVCGTARNGNQCRARFDTLYKAFKQAYEFCREKAKEFSEITVQEKLEMKLSTHLTREWYTFFAQNYTDKIIYKKSGKRLSDCPTSSPAEIQIEASVDCPSSPRIEIIIPSSSAGEFQSEILPEPPPTSPNNRHDGTPVSESLLTTAPTSLVRQKRMRRDENEIEEYARSFRGVYRRAVKDSRGAVRRYRYEPRLKPPGERTSISLGSYHTPEEASDIFQIAAYYYDRSSPRLDLGDGNLFPISDYESFEGRSLYGKDKAKWVQRKAREVFLAFQKEKARRLQSSLYLFPQEEQLSSANPYPEMQMQLPLFESVSNVCPDEQQLERGPEGNIGADHNNELSNGVAGRTVGRNLMNSLSQNGISLDSTIATLGKL